MPDTTREFYSVCPHCWSVRVKLRIFKTPRYKCEKCGSEFSNKKRISHANRLLFNKLMRFARSDLEQIRKSVGDVRVRKATVKSIKEYTDA